MTNPIRAALDKAAEEMNPDGFRAYPTARRNDAATCITKFLLTLQDGDVLTLLSKAPDPYYGWRETLADAVLAAAKDQTND
jgi:hypothetical protein